MHELSIAQSIIKLLEKECKKNKVKSLKKVMLKVGALKAVLPEALDSAFIHASKGTFAEDALLKLIQVPIVIKCKTCGKEYSYGNSSELITSCKKCKNSATEIISGNELLIDFIEYD